MPPSLLCESCGYPLPPGPHPHAAACPECGRRVSDSLPQRRHGVPWQQQHGVGSWARTATMLARSPRRFFNTLSTHGSQSPDRLYLLTNACAAGLIAGGLAAALHQQSVLTAWLVGMGTVKATIVFSYIEAAGLWFFSRRHGWSISPQRAERIVAYASIGWLPAAALVATAAPALTGPFADTLGQQLLGGPHPLLRPLLLLTLLGLVGLGFETLAWVGVRQLRYAN